ncbi:tensin-4-like [Lampris incognitus]|uniref:tensin-4-like n=1 Tax=Lampris incognitus TaxID=2546036 RepID=UPI0024B49AE5|nr:tensin-4-like [Lampris incognitus]
MMPRAETMSRMIPSHVLRVGQSIHLDSTQRTVEQSTCPTEPSDDPDLDISLDNLNQLILELDPTFEPIQVNKSPPSLSPHTDDSSPDDDVTNCVLVPRGCSPCISISPSPSHSIPIPTYAGPSCSPHGSVVFSSSPSSSRPPLPCGSVHRQNLPQKNEIFSSQGSLRMSYSNRNSGTSLLSTSPGSDTSYTLGSCLSLASEDHDGSECLITRTSGSFTEGFKTRPSLGGESPEKPSSTKPLPLEHFRDLQNKGTTHSSPASLSGSLTDIPLVLINGTPGPQLSHLSPQPEMPLVHTVLTSNSKPPHSLQAHFHGSQPSMKFVMDTSKLWFRPHINRAEAEALVRDKEPGTFVVRDSTSFRGSFGLAMKVDQVPTHSPTSQPGNSSSEIVRHFLIESSAKGVRIKGSSIEPYFGSLSALVYQHTISAYALPCKLLLKCDDVNTGEEGTNDRTTSEDKSKTACNFLYLNAVPTEMLTGPCAVKRAVSSTLEKEVGAITPTVVNLKVSVKGVTMTDINRKLFFRRHYPAHLLSYSGEDPDGRLWQNGSRAEARLFGIVAKGTEAGVGNVCHVFAEYDPLQPCNQPIDFIQGTISKS